jgi:hypothetical protein
MRNSSVKREASNLALVGSLCCLIAGAGYFAFFRARHPAETGARFSKAPTPAAPAAPAFRIPGMLEAEMMRITAKSREFPISRQQTKGWTNDISGEAHLFAQTREHDWVEMEFGAPQSGPTKISGYFTRNGDYGALRILVNGKVAVPSLDLSSPGFKSTGAVPFGVFELAQTGNKLRIEIAGKGKVSRDPFYQFGFDGIVMESVTGETSKRKI